MSLKKMLSAVALVGTLTLGLEAQATQAQVVGPLNQYALDYQEGAAHELQIKGGIEHQPTVLVFNEAPQLFTLPWLPGTTFLYGELVSAPFQLDMNGDASFQMRTNTLPMNRSVYLQAISVNRNRTITASNVLDIRRVAP